MPVLEELSPDDIEAAIAAEFERRRSPLRRADLTARDTGPPFALVPRAPEGPALGSTPLPPGYAEASILAERVAAYDPRADVGLITRAGQLAAEAHATQQRENGEAYITHPLAVAGILADYRLDSATIATALLHDVAEDTAVGLKEIERQFGAEVARLVDGVTKLTRIELQSERTKQAENLRKLVLAMSEDIRVLLVKLADRLHNMRTLHFVPQLARRQKTARETLEIFTPLAERIGMDALKTELETLAFQALHPEARQTIAARLTFLRGQGADLIAEIEQDLRRVLGSHDVTAVDVMGREKSPYSIWLKMQRKNVAFEALSDVMAFRVIVDDRSACYMALGAVHDAYRVVPGRFKDYISTPKTNGYQSLHTGVTVPARRNAKIEVQIRTREMHEVAEYGVAAHWIYKQGPGIAGGPTARKRYPWVRALLDILENAEGAAGIPRRHQARAAPGTGVLLLPQGRPDRAAARRHPASISPMRSTAKSATMRRCQGQRQDRAAAAQAGEWRPGRDHHRPRRPAQPGLGTLRRHREGARPHPPLRPRPPARGAPGERPRRDHQGVPAGGAGCLGKAAGRRAEGAEAVRPERAVPCRRLRLARRAGGGAGRGTGVAHAATHRRCACPGQAPRAPGAGPMLGRAERPGGRATTIQASMPVTGLVSGMPYHFAGCCHPLPGERILGIVTTGKGVTIHAADCRSLENFAAAPERFLDIDWDSLGAWRGRSAASRGNRQ